MLNSLRLNDSYKVSNWISTGALPEKVEPFNTNLALIISNLANYKVSLKFNNSVLVQKHSSLYHNFILQIYIIFELNNGSHDFALKNYLFGIVKLIRNTIKSKFINNREMAFDGKCSRSLGNDLARYGNLWC